jgi:hypothetical protein
MFGRPPSRLSQQQPLALPGDEVKDPRLGASPALSAEDVLIYAALYAVFDPRKGVEVEIEEALAITISDDWWQKISDEALAVATMRASSPKAKR